MNESTEILCADLRARFDELGGLEGDTEGLLDLIGDAQEEEFNECVAEHATPLIALHARLLALGIDDLAKNVVDGKYDAVSSEWDAWAETPEGKETYAWWEKATKGAGDGR